jgi:hypothetical protein
MRRPPGAEYREVAGWPAPGEEQKPGELARLAIEWIALNQEFIRAQLSAENGFDHRDVISLLMFRAYRGRGLVRPLQEHVEGTAPIGSPKGLLLRHVFWAAGECRSLASVRRETATDWSGPSLPVPPVWDSYGNESGYLRLIGILSRECHDNLADRPCAVRPLDLPVAVQHVTDRIPELWAIFQRYAPPSVSVAVSRWDEDDCACILLAIYPLELSHRAVTTYRQVRFGADKGAIKVLATQRKISRLRDRLRAVWPPELVPPRIKAAASWARGDDSTEEVS